MNSMFAKIYLAIMNRIETHLPEIVHVAQDHGQLEGYVRRPNLAFPCVLIDFQQWTFSNLAENVQMAEGDVVIRLAFAPYQDDDNLTEEYWRKMALDYYETEHKLNALLHGWSPLDDTGHLTRTHADKENRPALRIRPIRYRLEFEDYSAATEQEYGDIDTISIAGEET